MTDEQAAIERLRNSIDWRARAGYEGQCLTISWDDAKAILAEHPADDDSELTVTVTDTNTRRQCCRSVRHAATSADSLPRWAFP